MQHPPSRSPRRGLAKRVGRCVRPAKESSPMRRTWSVCQQAAHSQRLSMGPLWGRHRGDTALCECRRMSSHWPRFEVLPRAILEYEAAPDSAVARGRRHVRAVDRQALEAGPYVLVHVGRDGLWRRHGDLARTWVTPKGAGLRARSAAIKGCWLRPRRRRVGGKPRYRRHLARRDRFRSAGRLRDARSRYP